MTERELLGYRVCKAGLNNQKHCLLGLVVRAIERSADITLPALVNFATDKRGAVSEIPFGDVFDTERFVAMVGQLGVGVVLHETSNNVDFGEMFQLGSRMFREPLGQKKDLVDNFLRGLRPSIKIETQLKLVQEKLSAKNGMAVALQLRIEPDWQHYVRNHMSVLEGEDRTVSYQVILSKVAKTLGRLGKRVYVTCDEMHVPKEEITAYADEALNVSLLWKSDLVGGLLLREDDLCWKTSIDFELAVRADIFVGTCRSTFANTVCMTKSAISGAIGVKHYIYNAPGDLLGLRRDGGMFADYRNVL